ncbi:MAG: transposase [Cyanobium sp.]
MTWVRRWPSVSPRLLTLINEARQDMLAFRPFPKSPWRKIWNANPLEQVNK